MRRAFHLLAALVLGAAPAAAETVVLEADPWCPHTCAADHGPPGYMVEIAREALALAGHRVEYRNVAWARAMNDVRAGRADGAVGALAHEAGDLVLHREPLGMQANAFVVREDDPWTMVGLDSLGARVVGTIVDYSYSRDIDAWLAAHPGQVRPLGGEGALVRNIQKLAARRIDVVVDDEAVVIHTLAGWRAHPPVRVAGRLPGGALHIAFTRSDGRGERLAEALDRGIRELRRSGRVAEILARYGLRDWK